MGIISNSLITVGIITKSIVSAIQDAIINWFLTFDGTIYAELSEPITIAGTGSAIFTFSTSGGVLQDFTDAYSITALDVFSTPAEVTDILVDGVSVGLGGVAPTDGLQHKVEFVFSSMSIKNTVGANNGNGNQFQGVIYDALFNDGATPANSVAWKLDSGPAVYDGNGNVISDGTLYEPSEEHGVEADIMRSDDWNTPSTNVVTEARSLVFDGTQSAYGGANINQNEQYIGLHIAIVNVTNITQGSVRFGSDSKTYTNLSNGVHNLVFDEATLTIFRAADEGNEGIRLIGNIEVISINPVPKGLIYQNVTDEDWDQS